ncbi:DUF305 domain-containing protein [Amycolatopsis sp. PS_44_ISF1]|uniref:DUF305 domain-containing protein n=1 Tax=Amycolatopsis sp. PS_44_ISF1 TaxID=2974917 RepID=UPI0028DF9109|nr:DUF305 domain-containing protein [Amycolatopsis sp. PS_44_ISF1]MDT8916121.1 DUF305 domain-containing protein [Amycolatopsis sp. PS_44_ISF1]
MNRKLQAVFVLPAIAAALAGCSSPAPQTPPSAHNAADVTFARDMVPHHRQAVEMAAPVPQHTANQRVIGLAQEIQQAQQPEIDRLTQWLTAWGSAPAAPMSGMDHGASMPGMVDTAGLDRLHDQDYDRTWLHLMIQHHEGAVTMARTELSQGQDPAAKAMAQRITDTQQTEITTMKSLLGG